MSVYKMSICKLKEMFSSWIEVIISDFNECFSNDYGVDTLTFLHQNIDKEIETTSIIQSSGKWRFEALYTALTYLYNHFCYKIGQQEEFHNVEISSVKLLSQLIKTGLILSKGGVITEWINRILTAIKLYTGDTSHIYDALLLINNLKKKPRKAYVIILKHILNNEDQEFVSDPLLFMKIILLYRRLKGLIKNKLKKASVITMAAKLKPPSNLISWLLSFEVDGVHNLKHKTIVKQLMGNKFPNELFLKIREIALNCYNLEESGLEKVLVSNVKEDDLFIIDSSLLPASPRSKEIKLIQEEIDQNVSIKAPKEKNSAFRKKKRKELLMKQRKCKEKNKPKSRSDISVAYVDDQGKLITEKVSEDDTGQYVICDANLSESSSSSNSHNVKIKQLTLSENCKGSVASSNRLQTSFVVSYSKKLKLPSKNDETLVYSSSDDSQISNLTKKAKVTGNQASDENMHFFVAKSDSQKTSKILDKEGLSQQEDSSITSSISKPVSSSAKKSKLNKDKKIKKQSCLFSESVSSLVTIGPEKLKQPKENKALAVNENSLDPQTVSNVNYYTLLEEYIPLNASTKKRKSLSKHKINACQDANSYISLHQSHEKSDRDVITIQESDSSEGVSDIRITDLSKRSLESSPHVLSQDSKRIKLDSENCKKTNKSNAKENSSKSSKMLQKNNLKSKAKAFKSKEIITIDQSDLSEDASDVQIIDLNEKSPCFLQKEILCDTSAKNVKLQSRICQKNNKQTMKILSPKTSNLVENTLKSDETSQSDSPDSSASENGDLNKKSKSSIESISKTTSPKKWKEESQSCEKSSSSVVCANLQVSSPKLSKSKFLQEINLKSKVTKCSDNIVMNECGLSNMSFDNEKNGLNMLSELSVVSGLESDKKQCRKYLLDTTGHSDLPDDASDKQNNNLSKSSSKLPANALSNIKQTKDGILDTINLLNSSEETSDKQINDINKGSPKLLTDKLSDNMKSKLTKANLKCGEIQSKNRIFDTVIQSNSPEETSDEQINNINKVSSKLLTDFLSDSSKSKLTEANLKLQEKNKIFDTVDQSDSSENFLPVNSKSPKSKLKADTLTSNVQKHSVLMYKDSLKDKSDSQFKSLNKIHSKTSVEAVSLCSPKLKQQFELCGTCDSVSPAKLNSTLDVEPDIKQNMSIDSLTVNLKSPKSGLKSAKKSDDEQFESSKADTIDQSGLSEDKPIVNCYQNNKECIDLTDRPDYVECINLGESDSSNSTNSNNKQITPISKNISKDKFGDSAKDFFINLCYEIQSNVQTNMDNTLNNEKISNAKKHKIEDLIHSPEKNISRIDQDEQLEQQFLDENNLNVQHSLQKQDNILNLKICDQRLYSKVVSKINANKNIRLSINSAELLDEDVGVDLNNKNISDNILNTSTCRTSDNYSISTNVGEAKSQESDTFVEVSNTSKENFNQSDSKLDIDVSTESGRLKSPSQENSLKAKVSCISDSDNVEKESIIVNSNKIVVKENVNEVSSLCNNLNINTTSCKKNSRSKSPSEENSLNESIKVSSILNIDNVKKESIIANNNEIEMNEVSSFCDSLNISPTSKKISNDTSENCLDQLSNNETSISRGKSIAFELNLINNSSDTMPKPSCSNSPQKKTSNTESSDLNTKVEISKSIELQNIKTNDISNMNNSSDLDMNDISEVTAKVITRLITKVEANIEYKDLSQSNDDGSRLTYENFPDSCLNKNMLTFSDITLNKKDHEEFNLVSEPNDSTMNFNFEKSTQAQYRRDGRSETGEIIQVVGNSDLSDDGKSQNQSCSHISDSELDSKCSTSDEMEFLTEKSSNASTCDNSNEINLKNQFPDLVVEEICDTETKDENNTSVLENAVKDISNTNVLIVLQDFKRQQTIEKDSENLQRKSLRLKNKLESELNYKKLSNNAASPDEVLQKKSELSKVEVTNNNKSVAVTEENNSSQLEPKQSLEVESVLPSQPTISVTKTPQSSKILKNESHEYSLRKSKRRRIDLSSTLGIDISELNLDSPSKINTRSSTKLRIDSNKLNNSPTNCTESQVEPSSNKRQTRSSTFAKALKEAENMSTPNYNLRNRKSIIAPGKMKISHL